MGSLHDRRRSTFASLVAVATITTMSLLAIVTNPNTPALAAVRPMAVVNVTGPIDPSIGFGVFDLQGEISQIPTYGYTQEEFFLDGTATAYDAAGPWANDGKWSAVPTTTAAYKTRMVYAGRMVA